MPKKWRLELDLSDDELERLRRLMNRAKIPYAECMHNLSLRQVDEQELLVGMRVRLKVDVERYPHFIARAGLTGVVRVNDDSLFAVTMDKALLGAEAWDNQVCWVDDERDHLAEQLEVMGCLGTE